MTDIELQNLKEQYLNEIKDKKNALEIALKTRELEIDLYWRRTTYFSIIVGALFASYYSISNGDEKKTIICIFGALFSLGWFLANKGSKYWQENWEHHVEILEDHVVGPIFGTILERPPATNFYDKFWAWIIGPARYSVSAINTLISLFIFLAWIYLFFESIKIEINPPPTESTKTIIYTVTLFFGLAFLFWKGRSGHLHRSRFNLPGTRIKSIKYKKLYPHKKKPQEKN